MTDDIELPLLPDGYEPHELPADYTGELWIEGQVRQAQRAAVLADRARRVSAEPVAWISHKQNRISYTKEPPVLAGEWEPLYLAPPPTPPAPQQAEPAQSVADQMAARGIVASPDGMIDRSIGQFDPPAQQQAEPVQPYCYIYEYDGPFGLHREFYPCEYNGRKPDRTVQVFKAPPPTPLADAREAMRMALDAFDRMHGRRPDFVEHAIAALRAALKEEK
jgi:hypothetical protein